MAYNERYGKPPPEERGIDVEEREAQYDRCLALNQRIASLKGIEYRPIFAYGEVVRVSHQT